MPHEDLYLKTIKLLNDRGVTTNDIAKLVNQLQHEYFPDITEEECEFQVNKVLQKREVQNAVITGIELDILAEKKLLRSPLLEMLIHDDSLYGIDEIISLSIVNVYGSIGFTNYGYIDKLKPGIIGELNKHHNGQVNTFLDDVVGAIAAASSSRIAHNYDPYSH
ncbi:MAG: phosphatidylglycerophosphatase A [Vulcanibacillus sp.]